MSEEYEEVEGLTPEEIFEQHQAEIDKMFDEKGFFARLKLMFKGLKAPRMSREYKAARTELQRLTAPLIAILLPGLCIIVLIVVTAVNSERRATIQVEIGQIEESKEELDEPEDPPEEDIDPTEDIDVSVDVSVDVTPQLASPAPPSPNPGGEPDKVAAAPSPVVMSSVAGTAKFRGIGDGDNGGFGTVIGGKGGGGQNIEGCLIGIIIDFKSNPDGTPNPAFNDGNYYWESAKSLVDGDFSPAAIGKFFSPDKRVANNLIFIEVQDAGNGPKAFGVENVMKPRGFAVYYSGKIRPTEKAKYRFVGAFDDMMVIRLNKKVIFEDNWRHKSMGTKMSVTGWASSDPDNGKWPQLEGMASPLTIGDWWVAEPGKEQFLEILVGERPGGHISGVLLIQQEGVKYEMRKTNTTERPILPIFATRPLGANQKEKIRKYSESHDFKMSVDSPRFNAGKKGGALKKAMKNDVKIEIDI